MMPAKHPTSLRLSQAIQPVAMMSLRTTTEIAADPYAVPWPLHFDKFATAWSDSNYDAYFFNSVGIVLAAVTILTVVGGMFPR